MSFFIDLILTNREAVSQSADRDKVTRIGRIVLDFLPEPVDVNHDGILIYDGFAPDDAVDHVF